MNHPSRTAIILGAAAFAGASVGAVAFWLLTSPQFSRQINLGAWRSTAAVGEAAQDPYSRARVAMYGIWGLPPREAIYFTADRDDDGHRLRPDCTYQISGGALPTRWWSLTLYRSGFYVANPANRYSWSQTDVAKDTAGQWRIIVKPKGEGQNILTSAGGEGGLLVLLRLYQPHADVIADRKRTPLPSLRRVGCEPTHS